MLLQAVLSPAPLGHVNRARIIHVPRSTARQHADGKVYALSAVALGNLSALYFYTYVAIQIPTGVLVDHWGPRLGLTTGGLMAATGTLLFALASGYALVGVGRLLVGAGVGVAFVSMLKLVTHWVQPSRFALVSGLALACGSIGGISAGVPLRLAVDAFGCETGGLTHA